MTTNVPGPPVPWAAIAETHVSAVVFLGGRAYKVKKPVDLGFVDFTSREAREAACHREVALNRRLAPDVYLGVADVVGPDGTVADHLVVMRRMPAERRLSALVAAGDPALDDEVREVARTLARFHATAGRGPAIADTARAPHLAALWRSNLEPLRPFAGSLVDADRLERVEQRAERWLEGRAALLDERAAAGHAVDGHGDLLADDIFCLDDGPRILDCLEFDDHLRWGDVVADAAFLAMDLERLGRPDLARRFLAWYREFAAAAFPDGLAHHYVAYRALVRAKVACLRGDGNEASADLALAERHLEAARVRLVVVGGPPGTGKSTVAAALAERLEAALLRSDIVRKELRGLPPWEPGTSAGLYDAAHTDATYVALLERATVALRHGESVVLDATFGDDRWREAARGVAAETASDLTELRCAAPLDVARARVASRVAGTDASDATAAVAEALAARFMPWPEATAIDTTGALERSVSLAVGAVG